MQNNTLDLNIFLSRIVKSDYPVLCFCFDVAWSANEQNWNQRDRCILVSTMRYGKDELKLEFFIGHSNSDIMKKVDEIVHSYKASFDPFVQKFQSVFGRYKEFSEPKPGEYYKWLDESSFFRLFPKFSKFSTDRNGVFHHSEFAGLSIKNILYYQKLSDFGDDNYYTIIRGNCVYNGMLGKKEVTYHEDPRGDHETTGPFGENGKMVTIEQRFGSSRNENNYTGNAFTYFYDDKELLLVNYDEVKKGNHAKHYAYGIPIFKTQFPAKFFTPPEYLISKSFILTKEFEGDIQ